MSHNIPETMLAVFPAEEEGKLTSRRVPVPRPGPGEVLVKMTAAPINPSDLARIRNTIDPLERRSFIPGLEGSGTVVAHGKGLLPGLWQGKRVACSPSISTSGTWAEYMVTTALHCVPLPREMSDAQGSMLLVNPMTAVAFFDIVRRNHHKAIINTAAGSSLGSIVELLGKQHHIPVINIVRNEKQKKLLLNKGFQYVVDSSDAGFFDELCLLSQQLQATIVFDAVGGGLTRQIMRAVPFGSTIIFYGNLSGDQPEIDYRSIVMDNKKITGFFLGNWLKENGTLNMVRSIVRVRKLLKNQITLPVQGSFDLDEAQLAVDTYLGNMSAGKVLLSIHPIQIQKHDTLL